MTIIISKSELAKLNTYLANNPEKEGIEIELEGFCDEEQCDCNCNSESADLAREGEELLKSFN